MGDDEFGSLKKVFRGSGIKVLAGNMFFQNICPAALIYFDKKHKAKLYADLHGGALSLHLFVLF